MIPIKQVVDDPEWQALRRSLVGTWKRTADANVERLASYLGDGSDPLRVRRIVNYLTGSAFRIGVISSPAISALLAKAKTHSRA